MRAQRRKHGGNNTDRQRETNMQRGRGKDREENRGDTEKTQDKTQRRHEKTWILNHDHISTCVNFMPPENGRKHLREKQLICKCSVISVSESELLRLIRMLSAPSVIWVGDQWWSCSSVVKQCRYVSDLLCPSMIQDLI